MREHVRLVCDSPEVEAYCESLMETASRVRLPALFAEERPGTICRVPGRHGVATIGLRRSAITDEELVALLRYRLGQYVHPSIAIIDPRLVYESRLEHEPLENESPGDIHFISGVPETGEILCYAVLRALPDPPPDRTMRHRDRPALPVEKVHGWGVFNRLEVFPDLPVSQVFELGRYVKNHCSEIVDDRSHRAPTEIALAVFLALLGPLRPEVSAFVGDLEERIAKRTLDFFHIPLVVIRGVVPYSPECSYFFPRNQYCTVYPFVVLVKDLEASLPRFRAIEQALELPGREGLKALIALKRTSAAPKSSLEPAEGLGSLATEELPGQGGLMRHRAEILEIAADLRSFDAFSNLTDAEMRLLGGFMERQEVLPGQALVRQGDSDTDLFLIDEGYAEVCKRDEVSVEVVAELGPGDYFGEIALLYGGERTADVIARTPMSVLRLTREEYHLFLSRLEDVQGQIARTAAQRA